ncbi:MAG: CBM35 domain-containing protein, partial [Oscillospiraceae bacterium]
MNRMIKRAAALTAAASMSAVIFGGCAKNDGGAPADTTASVIEAAASESAEPPIEAIYGEIRTEYNTALDLSDYPLTPNDAPDGFEAIFEAEDGVLSGGCSVQNYTGASGEKYVSDLNKEGDSLTFNVTVDNSGFYDLNFVSQAPDPKRVNYVSVDGLQVGDIQCDNVGIYGDSYMKNVYLEAGS